MLRCSSSLDKNAVLMSLDANFQLSGATHGQLRASACAESVGSLEELLSSLRLEIHQDTEACFGFVGGLPRQHPSNSRHSIIVSNLLFTTSNIL